MKDIANRQDVELLVNEFYRKVRQDEQLGHIFDEVIKLDWEHHIPILCDFWDTILLDAGNYTRNAMAVHFDVNKKISLLPQHFTTWLFLFDETIDELFQGETADLAKKRAHSIAQLMQLKMEQLNR
jgi:hemoglobin